MTAKVNSAADSNFVGRVYQNDADTLDREAVAAVKKQLSDGAKYLMPGVYAAVEPEVAAAVRLLIWRYTVHRGAGTYGHRLLGLSYTELTPARSWMYAVLTVLGEWLPHRLPALVRWAAARDSTRHKALRAADRVELLLRVASLLNTLLFLRSGAFLTLTERLLRLRKQRAAPDIVSETNYTYLTREHLWRGFSELLMCLLPLIDLRQCAGQLRRLVPSGPGRAVAPPAFTARSVCVWCRGPPVVPQLLPCRHLACYYCLRAAGGQAVSCADCGATADGSRVEPAPVVRAAAD